jgi:hypothetical protein
MRREPKEELVKKCQSIPRGSDTSRSSSLSRSEVYLNDAMRTCEDLLLMIQFLLLSCSGEEQLLFSLIGGDVRNESGVFGSFLSGLMIET